MTADDALRDEIARALDSEGAFCGDCGGEPGEFYDSGCEGCRRVLHWYADAILPIVARVEQEAYRRGVDEVRHGYDEVKSSRDQLRGQVAEAYRRGQVDAADRLKRIADLEPDQATFKALTAREAMPALLAFVEAELDRHGQDHPSDTYCHCGYIYPCPTVRLAEQHLGGVA